MARRRKGNGVHWDTAAMEAAIDELSPRINAGLAATGSKIAADGEAWMKATAPWNDVTGAARNGLVGRYGGGAGGRDSSGKFTKGGGGTFSHRVTFSHTVDYGIWLEVRFDGRNAIIMPAVERFSVQWARLLGRLMMGG